MQGDHTSTRDDHVDLGDERLHRHPARSHRSVLLEQQVAATSYAELTRDLADLRVEHQSLRRELATLRSGFKAHGLQLRLTGELIAHEAGKRRELGRALRAFFVRLEHRIDRLHNTVRSLEAEELTRRRTWDALTAAFQHLVRLLGPDSSGE